MITKKLEKIKLLLLDVDGVLTDGSIVYNDHGQESKQFNVKDGFGMKLLMSAGIELGSSPAGDRRRLLTDVMIWESV